MKAYNVLDGKLSLESCKIPIAQEDQHLIKVEAIGLNRADLLQIGGLYNSPDGSTIPGLEVAGTVVGTNKKVAALLTSGGFAEYVCVKKALTLDIDDLDPAIAASLPEALTTCYLNLIRLGNLESAKSVLIHGGASGIGTFAIQIAKHYGVEVITSSSRQENISRCKELGASDVINYKNDFAEKYQNHFDLILDILGAEYLTQNMKTLRKYGRLVSIAVMNGAIAEINMAQLLMKNIQLIGSTLRSQSDACKVDLIKCVQTDLMPLIKNKSITPTIDSVFTFDKMDDALARMKAGTHFGKILVTV